MLFLVFLASVSKKILFIIWKLLEGMCNEIEYAMIIEMLRKQEKQKEKKSEKPLEVIAS